MKRRILKLLSIFLVSSSLFAIPVSAREYIGPQTISVTNVLSVSLDNSCWFEMSDSGSSNWYCTGDWYPKTILTDMWICTNGKWYYVDDKGKMATNLLILDSKTGQTRLKEYYVGYDGAMKVNTTVTIDNKQYSINSNGECKLVY